MELHILIQDDQDFSTQIYQQIRDAIESGRLADGQQVPPSRMLAEQLGITRKAVAEAYNRLTYEKKLVGYVGRGTFVHHPAALAAAPCSTPAPCHAALRTLKKWRVLDEYVGQMASGQRCAADFCAGEPSAAHFHQDEWRSCVLHGLRQSSSQRGKYGAAAGVPELRSALLRHAAFSRGVHGSPDQIIVTNGAQQALDLIGRLLIEPGACVAVEEPGYPGARLLFASMGARVVGVPVQADGIDVDAIPDQARLIYVTPAHQFPLGMPMSEGKRQALLEKANRIGAIIIEDDYDGEFRYGTRVQESLQSRDRYGVVAFVGTMSKVMLPELRMGYLIAPPVLADALVTVKRLTDWHANTMIQHALAKYLADGHLLRHVRRMQQVYARRHAIIQRMFSGALAPWFELLPADTGFHLSAFSRRALHMPTLLERAREAGIGLYSLAEFYYGDEARDGLFLGYGAIDTEAIEPALATVRDIARTLA